MVRDRVRKTNQESWDQNSLRRALDVFITKRAQNFRKTDKTYDVPKDSLRKTLQKLMLFIILVLSKKITKLYLTVFGKYLGNE